MPKAAASKLQDSRHQCHARCTQIAGLLRMSSGQAIKQHEGSVHPQHYLI
jgi:hypothetical protein